MKTTTQTTPSLKRFPVYVHDDGKQYSLPYPLPPGEKGKFKIEVDFKPAGKELTVVSMRNALFMGLRPTMMTLTAPLGVHTLSENGRATWMTSLPQEIEQHHRQLANVRGTVLVGGLGLGVAVALLEKNPRVKNIVVVEKSSDVIELIKPYVPQRKTTFVHGDLYDYLKENEQRTQPFDCAFYDIWCPTGERVLTEHVLPLRLLSEGVVNGPIECWNEDEMIGQIRMNCLSRIQLMLMQNDPLDVLKMDEDRFQRIKSLGLSWYFHRWMREAKPTQKTAEAMLQRFCADIKNPRELQKNWGAEIQ